MNKIYIYFCFINFESEIDAKNVTIHTSLSKIELPKFPYDDTSSKSTVRYSVSELLLYLEDSSKLDIKLPEWKMVV